MPCQAIRIGTYQLPDQPIMAGTTIKKDRQNSCLQQNVQLLNPNHLNHVLSKKSSQNVPKKKKTIPEG